MNRFVMTAAAALLAAGAGRAQQVVFPSQVGDPGAIGGEFLLAPVETPLVGLEGGPGRPVLGGPTAPPVPPGALRGVAGGFGVGGNGVNASVGFTYLVPLYSFRDFQLAAPKGFEPFFPVFGLGRVDNRFAYTPQITVGYDIKDLDLGVSASGSYLNLSGRIDRQQATTGGVAGQLDANATVSVVSANLIEFNRLYAFTDLFDRKEPKHQNVADSVVDLRIGTRYLSTDQNYTGVLTGGVGGGNVTTRFSTQSFRGIGLTTGSRWTVPLTDDVAGFLSVQGSLLIGENRRNSTVTAAVAGLAPFSATQFESRTQLVPVTELELGFDWGRELGNRLRNGLGPAGLTVRVAAVGQYYGGLGPFSAGSTQGFRTTDLFLVGGLVQAGIRY